MNVLQPRTRAALLAELDANRAAFFALLETLSDADLLRPSTKHGWSVREVLHLIVWKLACVPYEIDAAQRNQRRAHVARWFAERRAYRAARRAGRQATRQFLSERYRAAHQAAVAVLEQLSEHDLARQARFSSFEGTFEGLFREQSAHFAEHAAQVLRAYDLR